MEIQTLLVILEGIIICFLILTLAAMSRKKKFVNTEPTVIIKGGRIIEKALRDTEMSIDELMSEARLSGFFNLGDIDYALLEANGEISFLAKPKKRPLCPSDFNFAPVREGLCTTVVLDGELLLDNIEKCSADAKQIIDIIESRGRRVENLLLATINEAGRIDVFEKVDNE
ncbi:MAG: DUF421 domain-containing protein [Eubacterium sp.]|nr:DUF421 domain-containing protein [Eubacterium sp.]